MLIIGAGGYGREIYNMAPFCQGYGEEWDIKGFLDDTPDPLQGFEGYGPIVGKIHDYQPQDDDCFTCAIGSVAGKRECVHTLLAKGAEFLNLIHQEVTINRNVVLGQGCIISKDCIIGSDATIGSFVTLQIGCMIGHDSKVGDWCHLHPRVFMGGRSTLHAGVHIGYGAFVHPDKVIESDATIAAGAYVYRNVKSGTTVIGNPATVFYSIKKRETKGIE